MSKQEILNQIELIMSKGSGYSSINEELHFFLRCHAKPFVPFLDFNTTKEEYLSIHKKFIDGLEKLLNRLDIKHVKDLNGIIATRDDADNILSNRRATNLRYDNKDVMEFIFDGIEKKNDEKPKNAKVDCFSQIGILKNLYRYMVSLQASLYFKLNDKETNHILFSTFKRNLEDGSISEDNANEFLQYIKLLKESKVILSTNINSGVETKIKIVILQTTLLGMFHVILYYDSPVNSYKTINSFVNIKDALNHYQRVSLTNAFNNHQIN